jgi:YHS domain-containing protein
MMVVLALRMPVMASPVFAAKKAGTGIVDAGNKMCPVSGDKVSGKDFVTYKGKRYGLCCPMCKAPFLNDPEKYITQMKGKEKTSAPTVAPKASKSQEMERAMEQGSL